MTRFVFAALAISAGFVLSADTHQISSPQPGPSRIGASPRTALLSSAAVTAVINEYCLGCHDEWGRAGGLSLDDFDAAKADRQAATAEKMIRKLRAGLMPPPAARHPDAATIAALVETLETTIDRAAAVTANPSWHPFRRLNRVEYAAELRRLLGLDIDVTRYLPPDTMSAGFDNVADEQSFSPQLMDGYLRAASEISRLAIGDRTASATSVTYKIRRNQSQMRHVDGAPIGTRGGIAVVHVFPADGEYAIKVSLHNTDLGGLFGRFSMLTMGFPEQIDIAVDGARVALLEVNPAMSETDFGQNKGRNGLELRTAALRITAGPHRVSAAFIQRLDGPVDDLMAPYEFTAADVDVTYGTTALPHIRDMTILGPTHATGVSDTVSRRRILTCRPSTPREEEPCARKIVTDLVARAFRGKHTADDIADAMQFYARGRENGDFESGIRMALQFVLMNPRFLFLLERDPTLLTGSSPAAPHRIDDLDLASRLSFFLWGTGPDPELIQAAHRGSLQTSMGLQRQVRRLLTDPRSEALSTRFASQWLRLQDLDKMQPDYALYPQYDQTLEHAMQRETELFFDSIVRDDRNVLDLLTADYTFVNDRLASHYAIANVNGSAFRRVQVPDYRRGLLGQGSILTLTSVADRTSPVLRGKWVMEVLLGTPPPPPPPGVPTLDESTKPATAGKLLSTRERMDAHRSNPACNSCHRVIDPLGLALENFDATGAWRIKDNEVPVDTVGDLYDGTKINGPAGLRQALLRHSDMVLRSFTQNLMTYALGRRLEYSDMPTVRAIVNAAATNDNRFSAFVLGIVGSAAFQSSNPEAANRVPTPAPDR